MGTLSSIGSLGVAAAALSAQIANAAEATTEVEEEVVVTEEDVGKFPDHNVAEALQRVTGVQITRDANEGKFVNVRGLPSEFNHVTLNGQAVTSASDNQIVQGADRNFDFSLLATDFISSLRVYKTPRVDLEEGALAATVDIQTLRPFDLDGRRIVLSAQAQEYDIKGEQEPNIAALYSDLWFDRRVGLTVGAAWNRRFFQGQSMDTAQLDPRSRVRHHDRATRSGVDRLHHHSGHRQRNLAQLVPD